MLCLARGLRGICNVPGARGDSCAPQDEDRVCAPAAGPIALGIYLHGCLVGNMQVHDVFEYMHMETVNGRLQ